MATGSSTLVKVGSDGGLVLATLAGDQQTFATLYDRFAARIYDMHLALLRDQQDAVSATHRTFQIAVAKLNRLADSTRLRPWLYTLAYAQATQSGTARAKARRAEPAWIARLPPGPGPQAQMWQLAPDGLGPKDVALLTLHLRHGLPLDEVGSITGLGTKRVRSRLNSLHPDLQPMLRALRVPPHTEYDPSMLAAPGMTSDENPTPLRVAVPFAAPPPQLREQVVRGIPLISAHEGLPRPRTPTAWTATALAALLLISGTVLFVHRGMERRPVIAVRFGPASEFALSTTMIDLGASASAASVTLSNTGGNTLNWRADPADPWLKVSPPSGSLAGGQSQQLTVTADRNSLPEGDGRTALKFTSATDQSRGEVAVALREERPPSISRARASSSKIGGFGCATAAEIRATVTDESPPIRVVLIGPGSQTQVMKAVGNTYTGRIGSGSHANITWRIQATDARNNTATSPAQTIQYADCAARPSAKPKPSETPSASNSPDPSESPTADPTSPPGSSDDTGGGSGAGSGDNGSDSGSGDTGSGSGDNGSGDSGSGSGDSGSGSGGDSGSGSGDPFNTGG